MKIPALSLIATFAFTTTAFAFWDIKNSEEDVFGNVNVTASSFGDNGSLIRFECGSSDEPFFVFLLRDSTGEIPDIPATFLHVDQNGEREEVDATLESWNDKYVAVKVTDKAMLRRIAEHMMVAKKSIPVGITIPATGGKMADTFSPRGSTAAGKIILNHCLPDSE
ncbi:MAG: hypothetical protein AB8G77_24665 [Rhodothermales bacterium]